MGDYRAVVGNTTVEATILRSPAMTIHKSAKIQVTSTTPGSGVVLLMTVDSTRASQKKNTKLFALIFLSLR